MLGEAVAELLSNPLAVGAPERGVALDMFRRGFLVGPALVAISSGFWGLDGLASSAFALGLVLVNLLAGAWLIDWAIKISTGLLMGAVLGGFLLRMGILAAAVVPVRDLGWFEITSFSLTLLVTHLGLLIWETKFVSATLAYPGLKPSTGQRFAQDKE